MRHCAVLASIILTVFLLSACKQIALPDDTVQSSQLDQSVFDEKDQSASLESEQADHEAEQKDEKETSVEELEHSSLYIPDLPVEDVIRYFNEVCLDGEFINSGDPRYVQKWMIPIYYTLEGHYTDTDVAFINYFAIWLNCLEGFPGIYQTEDPMQRNLRICFSDQQEMLALMGENFTNMDGAVTFWYIDDKIYDAIICYRTDIDQQLRNSVIIEEIYNGLGPIQDTALRPDSIIYQAFSQPQWLSEVDCLILQLLYHPDIQPGMNAQQCEQIIRSLYY